MTTRSSLLQVGSGKKIRRDLFNDHLTRTCSFKDPLLMSGDYYLVMATLLRCRSLLRTATPRMCCHRKTLVGWLDKGDTLLNLPCFSRYIPTSLLLVALPMNPGFPRKLTTYDKSGGSGIFGALHTSSCNMNILVYENIGISFLQSMGISLLYLSTTYLFRILIIDKSVTKY